MPKKREYSLPESVGAGGILVHLRLPAKRTTGCEAGDVRVRADGTQMSGVGKFVARSKDR